VILNALAGKSLPIYGDGMNVRDWLYVEDHCEALRLVLEKGQVGEVYNIGGRCEKTNLEIVQTLCSHLDQLRPDSPYVPHASLIGFVKDRPGHDRRYAIDTSKIEKDLGWSPNETLYTGLKKTIQWYFENPHWVKSVQIGVYRKWIQRHYGDK